MITFYEILSIKEIAASSVQALATVVAVYLAYRFALKQMQKQARQEVQEDLRKRQADALQSTWALLFYLTQTDNQSNIIRVTRTRRPAGKTVKQEERERSAALAEGKTRPELSETVSYQLHVSSAQKFVFVALPATFYTSGMGLHWSSTVKELFFEARSILYGYLLSKGFAHAPGDGEGEDGLCVVNNPHLAERLKTIYDTLNQQLRKELQAVYDDQHLVAKAKNSCTGGRKSQQNRCFFQPKANKTSSNQVVATD